MHDQLYTFLLMTAAGASLALLFDCYRVTRNYLRLRWFATAAADLLYWLVATAVVFLTLLKGNWGEIRFYIFLALFSGAGLYFQFVSVYVVAIMRKVLLHFGKLLRIVYFIINFIIVRPFILPLRWVSRQVTAGCKRLIRSLKPPKDGKPPEM